jgi:hypothetical protein
MREHGNHVLICVVVKMVDFISPVEDVCEHVSRWCVNDCGRDYIWHISMVTILWYSKLLVAVEATDSGEMNVTSQNCYANGFLRCELLEFLNEPVALLFVMFCSPMVI